MNEVCSAAIDLKERVTSLTAQGLSVVQSPSPPPTPVVKPTYSVILKQPSKGLDKPAERKYYPESLADRAYCSHILDLKPLREEWRIVLNDKKAAATLANSAQDAKLKAPLHLGVIRHVPDDISDLDICTIIQNCVKAEKIGQTRSYKLMFEQKADLQRACMNPTVFGYERHRIEEYRFLPMRCCNSQHYGHSVKVRKNSACCSWYAGDHSNS